MNMRKTQPFQLSPSAPLSFRIQISKLFKPSLVMAPFRSFIRPSFPSFLQGSKGSTTLPRPSHHGHQMSVASPQSSDSGVTSGSGGSTSTSRSSAQGQGHHGGTLKRVAFKDEVLPSPTSSSGSSFVTSNMTSSSLRRGQPPKSSLQQKGAS